MRFTTLLLSLIFVTFVLPMSFANAQVADASTLTSVNGQSGNIAGPKAINCPSGNCAKNMPDPPGCGFNCPAKLMPEGAAADVKKTTKEGTVTE